MAIDASQLTEYTFAQIRTAAKVAMVNAAVGGTQLSIGGRNIGRITPKEARDLYEWADMMVKTEDNASTGGMIALTKFGQRQ